MGMSCGWFRPITGTHQEGNPRPPCDLCVTMCPYTWLPVRTASLPGSSTVLFGSAPYSQPKSFPKERSSEDYGSITIIIMISRYI